MKVVYMEGPNSSTDDKCIVQFLDPLLCCKIWQVYEYGIRKTVLEGRYTCFHSFLGGW